MQELLAFLLLSDTIVKSNQIIKQFTLHHENLIREIFALFHKFHFLVKFPFLINNLFCRCGTQLLLWYSTNMIANEFDQSKAMVSNTQIIIMFGFKFIIQIYTFIQNLKPLWQMLQFFLFVNARMHCRRAARQTYWPLSSFAFLTFLHYKSSGHLIMPEQRLWFGVTRTIDPCDCTSNSTIELRL